MRRLTRVLTPLLFALLPSSCLLVGAGAAAGAGFLISREVTDDVHSAHVNDDVDHVWTTTQETLRILTDVGAETTVTQTPRVIHTEVGGASVEVTVQAYDLDRTLVKVRAEKYLQSDDVTADEVLDKILARLGE